MAEPGSDLLSVTADGDSDHESELSRLEVRRSSQHELTSIGREEVESEKGTDNETKPYIHRSVLRSWSLELGAICLSLVSFITIFVVFSIFNHKPLSNWNFPTSLNAVTAVLGTISRASLAFAISACFGQQKWNWHRTRRHSLKAFGQFDEASRGPYGSIQLLFGLRFRHWSAIGALAGILLLGYDAFLQAAIGQEAELAIVSAFKPAITQRLTRMDSGNLDGGVPPWIYQLNVSTSGTTDTRNVSIELYSQATSTDLAWSAAVLSGFANETSFQSAPPVSCDTGNCTWPRFTSLAICSSCVDVTPHISISLVNITDPAFQYIYPATMYSLPHVSFANHYNYIIDDTLVDSAPLMALNATAYPWETISYQDYTTLISSFAFLRAPDSFIQNKTRWNESSPTANECALYYCVNEYEFRLQNRSVQETITRSTVDRNPASFSYEGLTGDAARNLSDWNKATWPALWRREGHPVQEDLQLRDSGKQFNISQASIVSMIQYLLQWSVGQERYGVARSSIDHDYFTPTSTATNAIQTIQSVTIDLNQSVMAADYPLVGCLWDSTNYTETFANVARDMSDYLRGSGGTVEEVQGDTLQWATHILIRWPYLTAPLVSLILGILYIVLTVWETSHLRLPPWKESVIPSLAYGLGEDQRTMLAEADRVGKMNKVAKNMMVRLTNDGGGDYRLISA